MSDKELPDYEDGFDYDAPINKPGIRPGVSYRDMQPEDIHPKYLSESKVTLEIIEGPDYGRDEDGWEHNAYKLRLTYKGYHMTTPWKQGLGITDDPTAEDVLENLASDASSADEKFEDWAMNYGYDTDSRKAEATYKAVVAQTRRLKKLLGDDFDAIVFKEED